MARGLHQALRVNRLGHAMFDYSYHTQCDKNGAQYAML